MHNEKRGIDPADVGYGFEAIEKQPVYGENPEMGLRLCGYTAMWRFENDG